MCLYINSDSLNGKIADKNIICYKLILLDYGVGTGCKVYTPYQYMSIERNCTTLKAKGETTIESWIWGEPVIEAGAIHTFADLDSAVNSLIDCESQYRLIKCYIPKGTVYYEGTFKVTDGRKTYVRVKSYASEQIKFIEPICPCRLWEERGERVCRDYPLTIYSSLFEEESGLISDILDLDIPQEDVDSLCRLGLITIGISPKGETWKITKSGKADRRFMLEKRTTLDKIFDWFVRKIGLNFS